MSGGLFNVIKFDGVPNREWVMYKYPGHEFLDKSTLIVGVGQVAIAVHGGKIENIFESGTYKLTTENFPFLRGLVKAVHGGEVPFTMEIYFFNTTVSLKNVWGTQAPIQMIDPKFNVKARVRANGQYALKLEDYQLFFSALTGTVGDKVLYEFSDITNMFRGIINTKISVILGEYIIKNGISFLDISLYLDEISTLGKTKIEAEFKNYGLRVINFYFSSINVPEDDLAKINEYLNKRAEFEIMGDDRYRVARSFDVLEKAAANEGAAGAVASSGIGLGIGIGMAPTVGQAVQQAAPGGSVCRNCGREIPAGANFCPFCGTRKMLVCPSCKKELSDGMLFCPFCGTKLQ